MDPSAYGCSLAGKPGLASTIVVDLSNVHSVTDVARRMLLEGMRRLQLDGHTVHFIDEDEVLPEPDPGDGQLLGPPPMEL